MALSGGMLNAVFTALPKGCHVELIVETEEVRHAVIACADIITRGFDKKVFCQLEAWRHLMDTWKERGSQMRLREFEENVDDADWRRVPVGGPSAGLASGEGCGGGEGTPHGVLCLRGQCGGKPH
jgi:hypothetical protein